MAQQFTTRGNKISLHYAGRNRSEMAYLDRLEKEFAKNIFTYSAADNSRLNVKTILTSSPDNSVFYFCGPNKLIDEAITISNELKIDPCRIRFERFAAKQSAAATKITVILKQSNKTITVAANETILDAILDAGIPAPYGCKTGTCRTCAVKVLAGEAVHEDLALTDKEKNEQQLMCPCVSRSHTKHLTLDI